MTDAGTASPEEEVAVGATDTYSPEPNILEDRFAGHLVRNGADRGTERHPSDDCVQEIGRVTRWTIGLAALAGLISGGVIGGTEVWMRQGLLDGMEDMGWRETWPYWTVFYIFVGVISAVEIALLYALALAGIARITRHSGLALARSDGLFAHGLARTALEFPSPQVNIYGIDPYAHVAGWKLTALNIAYKLKVGVTSFVLRVFLRRVAARAAIRGLVPLMAGPLYAAWNAYIIWRILREARVRTLGPFAVDALIETRFGEEGGFDKREADVILHGVGEMLTRGQDAHPNQVYLMSRLRTALGREGQVSLDWVAKRGYLPGLEAEAQTRVLDALTVSCIIGRQIRSAQTTLLREACEDCGATLNAHRLAELRKALLRGQQVTADEVAATRGED